MSKLNSLFLICLLVLVACGGDVTEKKNDELKVNTKINTSEVMSGISVELLNEELRLLPDDLLRKLLKKSEDRNEFLKGVFAEKKLSEKIKETGIDGDKQLKRKIKVTINNIYIERLVQQYFNERKEDLITLARDKYISNKDSYKVRRRIKIAQIYISKINRSKEESKKLISDIEGKLKGSEDHNFFEIADDLSDKQPGSIKGGIFEKWLIYPGEGKKLNKVLSEAFSLKKVGDETDVIETGQGYHIIKLIEELKGKEKSFKAVKDIIVSDLRKELMTTIKNEVRASLYPPAEEKYDDVLMRELLLKEQETRETQTK